VEGMATAAELRVRHGMAAGDQTIRFRAESRITYARALIVLTQMAWDTAREFTFGPLDAAAVEEQGLVVSGPDVLEWADDFMEQVPGLHRADE
jgi:hypothetical protein